MLEPKSEYLFPGPSMLASPDLCDVTVSCQPRMHDLRHTFAVHRITGWIKHGANLNRMMPALAVYLGQSGLGSTERYLSLTPERFRTQLDKLSPRRGRKRWRDDPALMKFLAEL
jgi:integrase/recombinase XerD